MSSKIKGFKAMDKNMKCRNLQFKIGKEYKTPGLSMCGEGFHFCENLMNVYSYYPKSVDTVVCEVEALGETLKEGDKSATNHIKILRRLTETELLTAFMTETNAGNRNAGHYNAGHDNAGHDNAGTGNAGHYNAGHDNAGNRNAGTGNAGHDNAGTGNAGNRNAGHDNAGHYNAGHDNAGTGNAGNRNAGHYNAGHDNAGHDNAGNRNAGHYNAGHDNAGNRNAGNYNAGHDNAGTGNAGFFNLADRTVSLFDKDSGLAWDSYIIKTLKCKLDANTKPILRWIGSSDMTDVEKKEFPSHVTTGGFLRNMGRTDYSALNNPSDLKFFQDLPGFDAEIFFKITGIDTRKPKTVKVSVEGEEYEIDLDKAKELGLVKKGS